MDSFICKLSGEIYHYLEFMQTIVLQGEYFYKHEDISTHDHPKVEIDYDLINNQHVFGRMSAPDHMETYDANKLSFNKATELYFDKYDISYDCILRYKAEYLQLKLEEIENLMHQLKQDQPHQKEPLRIGVGVGVMVFKNNQVLLGRRLGSHGEGEYAFPGGHLDHLESIEKCAQREVMEETGMKIKNIKFLRLYNLKEYAPKHYIDIGMTAEWESGNPKLLEPNKCEGWNWYDLDNLPQPLFATTETYLDAIKNGKNFYDQ